MKERKETQTTQTLCRGEKPLTKQYTEEILDGRHGEESGKIHGARPRRDGSAQRAKTLIKFEDNFGYGDG